MRFYRSVKICKGVRLNFSKSGVGMSIGPKGAKISIGPRGTYLNTSIPGTGLSQRTKLSGRTSSKRSNSLSSNDVARRKYEMMEKNAMKVDEYNEKNEQLINVVSLAPNVLDPQYFSSVLKRIVPAEYKRNTYPEKRPSEESIRKMLEHEAEQDITGWKIWEVSKKRKEYVEKYFPSAMQDAMDNWEYNKDQFEKQEDIKESKANTQAVEACNQKKIFFSKLINGDKETVTNSIEAFLHDIEMPFDFNVNYELRDASTAFVDLDLPEIEMLPDKVAVQLANGTMKEKNITQTKL